MISQTYNRIATISLSLAVFILSACSSAKDTKQDTATHYSMADFATVKKIDAHVHANNGDSAFIEQAQADNFALLSINVDYPDFPDIDIQQDIALSLSKQFPETLYFAATFSMDGWDEDNWQSLVTTRLNAAVKNGAKAVKVWKNIGMSYRDENQQLVMIDNPGLDPIFSHLTQHQVPVIGHQGEPHNCWLPIEQMSVNNDKQYFAAHPQYHMYLHPEMPSYEAQMAARNNMLDKHQSMQFIGAHLASLEWSVDEMAVFLDRYPNASLDLAARMGQVQAQSVKNRQKVRAFLIQYQDRIVYATDLTYAPDEDAQTFKTTAHQKWLQDWRYLNTDTTLTVPEVDGTVTGLALPKAAIGKIYYHNAQRIFTLK
ncbi:amidohydrolase family protein [Aliiglaciecola sp. LCG003]|uniref:amidohydrolase family protein n=1 Tax=Aliiglaciecola sp. LCG003 TaxID=3053655 RepID=UPI002573516C|nr:amidohydrolase family protein [Aliiglaciecola sp. LCG003]WJG09602.1 amidohydrolase family protein [Aliiglaciecola sp. LCG003]